ncbi:MAG: DUF3558 family protein, partial [Catenulispora sp.]
MQIHLRQVAAAAAIAIVAAGSAACGGNSDSSPKSSGSQPSGSTSSGPLGETSAPKVEPADANTSAGKGLAGIDFCGLVDPAALAAIGIQQPKGQPTDPLDFPGCTWKQGSTLLKLSTALGTNDDLASGDKQDFSGFPGAAKYNDVTGDCVVTINIGPDQL